VSRSYLNLAREPYVNTRPVVRLSIVLWLVGVLLFAGNVWLYWDFLAGRGDTHARLETVSREIDTTRSRIDSLESELAGFDLADQNDRVEFLNTRIDRRHFSWSQLFDALAELLPDDVRLRRLTPSSLDSATGGRRRTRRSTDEDKGVSLQIQGVARSNDSVLTLVDHLFEDSAFEEPSLTQQRNGQGGLIEFDIDTTYDPRAAEKAEPEAAPAPDGPDATAATGDEGEPQPAEADLRPTDLGPAASAAPEVVR